MVGGGGRERGEGGARGVRLGLQFINPGLDGLGLDSGLQTAHPSRYRPVGLPDCGMQLAGLALGAARLRATLLAELLSQQVHPYRAEYALREETFDEGEQNGLAHVARDAVLSDAGGSLPAVFGAEPAAVVDVARDDVPGSTQRLMASGAADHAAE